MKHTESSSLSKTKTKRRENKSKCFDMKFIVIVIDEDYTSLKSENKQTKVKTNEHKITEKVRKYEKNLVTNSKHVIGYTRLPSVTSLSVE